MQTKYIQIKQNKDFSLLDRPAQELKNGGLVVFPTETVYGLGANAKNAQSVKGIFEAKGRPSDNPLIVHISHIDQLDGVVSEVTDRAKQVMDALWPGPITLVMKKNPDLPDAVTAGLDTVAVRMPSHPVALALIQKSGVPVAAPSANTSGKPSPTKAEHAYADLDGKVAYIIDGGSCDVGLESTVLDITTEVPQILRPGGVSKETLEKILGKVVYDKGLTDSKTAPKSPGMKYKHYAPKAQMFIVEGDGMQTEIEALLTKFQAEHKRVGILTAQKGHAYPGDVVLFCGAAPEEYASHLFDTLRAFDKENVDVILAEMPFGDSGLAPAIKNRIYKAAGGNIIYANHTDESPSPR